MSETTADNREAKRLANLARKRRLQCARVLYPTKPEHMQPTGKHWPARRVVNAAGVVVGYEARKAAG